MLSFVGIHIEHAPHRLNDVTRILAPLKVSSLAWIWIFLQELEWKVCNLYSLCMNPSCKSSGPLFGCKEEKRNSSFRSYGHGIRRNIGEVAIRKNGLRPYGIFRKMCQQPFPSPFYDCCTNSSILANLIMLYQIKISF